uniref:Uncharacterized protein n=1 Tax=Knipowitschia caucasica TaxID=637954 RepID=A0AAV2L5V8_KNICA
MSELKLCSAVLVLCLPVRQSEARGHTEVVCDGGVKLLSHQFFKAQSDGRAAEQVILKLHLELHLERERMTDSGPSAAAAAACRLCPESAYWPDRVFLTLLTPPASE